MNNLRVTDASLDLDKEFIDFTSMWKNESSVFTSDGADKASYHRDYETRSYLYRENQAFTEGQFSVLSQHYFEMKLLKRRLLIVKVRT